MHRIFLIFLLCILNAFFSQGQFNNITIKIYKGNKSSTLINTVTIQNETQITEIIIEEEDIPILKAGVFDSLYLLDTLKIQRTNLEILEENIFAGLKRIRNINFNFNRIQHVPTKVFKNIPVYKISLRGNGIKTISEKAFFYLYNLHELDLSNNDIELLPKNLFVRTKNVKYLDLSNNKLRHFPAVPYRPYAFFDVAFSNMAANESSTLDLSYNNFTFISYYLLRGVYYIEDLRLHNNNIDLISEYAFDDFKKIENLYLEGNNLKEFSDGLLGVMSTSVKNIIVNNNPWNNQFVCKYDKWCNVNNKTNFMEFMCFI